MANQLLEKIFTRRCIRVFKNKKVSKKDLESIVEAGLRAPSSKNSEPWYLVVVEGEEKEEVAKSIEKNFHKYARVPQNTKGQKITTVPDTTRESIQIIRDSSALILIFDKQPYSKGIFEMTEIEARVLYSFSVEIVGIGACMENVLLAAHSLGLGAVPIADIYPAALDIKKKFKIPYMFSIGIAIGYPGEKVPKRRINKKKFTKWI
ncbi:MAG: nitroreductase family protein [Candidatus Magasanikbacteria bacterium]|nr:nitroreductase family protein [Candidatus Magasanikbacteria bacterium]